MMNELTTVAPSLAYLLALAEDPCLWLLVIYVCDRAVIPAVRRWRARRVVIPAKTGQGSEEKENE
jgi:hypothetical protein